MSESVYFQNMVSINVTLPSQMNLSAATSLYARIHEATSDLEVELVNIDLSRLAFVTHDGVTILANYLEWLKKRGAEYRFINADITRDAVRYLDDCQFFAHYLGEKLSPFSHVRDSTIPFTSVHTEQFHSWIENNLCPWICRTLRVTSSSIDDLRASLREVFNNIVDHSTEQIGCVHAQHYPRENSMGISISDFGVGIPQELGKAYRFENDGEALMLASRDGITSKLGRNRGAGLCLLIDTVVALTGGTVCLYSGRGSLFCDNTPQGVKRTSNVHSTNYPGTLVSVRLRTDHILNQPEVREDLQW